MTILDALAHIDHPGYVLAALFAFALLMRWEMADRERGQ